MSAGFRFQPEWRITLFALVLVPLMIGLGFWQLSRAQEKAVLAADFESKRVRSPAPLSALAGGSAAELAYLPVRLEGRFREGQYFLLDNRMQDRRYGNEVLAVFELAGGGLVLVNRGWVAADPARRTQPVVPAVEGLVKLTGHVYVAPGDPYLLAEQRLEEGWPKPIQAVEMSLLATALPRGSGDLFPYPVRIDTDAPGALAVDWRIINVSPRKHQGYAVQWFTMAAVLALFYLLHSSNLWQLLRGGDDQSDGRREG